MTSSRDGKTTENQEGGQRHRRVQQDSTEATGPVPGAETETATTLAEGVGGDFSDATFQRHAALLGDPRMSHPANARQRAQVVQRLQRDYGNQYVQRVVEQADQARAGGSNEPLTDSPILQPTATEPVTNQRGRPDATPVIQREWEGPDGEILSDAEYEERFGLSSQEGWTRISTDSKQDGSGAEDNAERPDLGQLRSIALDGFIKHYNTAAKGGLDDFEDDMEPEFDWAGFWRDVGIGVAFATAAFASGGTAAFAAGVSQVALTTAVNASDIRQQEDHKDKVDRFIKGMKENIDDVVDHLKDQVDQVTKDVYNLADQEGWGYNKTRLELLKRLLKPNFISIATGGIPDLDQKKVRASVREELLIKASQMTKASTLTSPSVYGPGYFEETWKVIGAIKYIQYPMSPKMPVLQPLHKWAYSLDTAELINVSPDIPDINGAINEVYETYGTRIDPTQWPINKRLVLTGAPPFGVTYHFDKDNNFTGWTAPSFAAFLKGQGRNADAYLRSLLGLIQRHSGATIPSVRQLQ